MTEWDDLVEIMNRLRAECPWDREQTLETLRKYLMEEAYESLEALNHAIESETPETIRHLREELGDLLLQILFQSKILREKTGNDELRLLLTELKAKLVRRHPHIFNDAAKNLSAQEVHDQWNKIKAAEKGTKKSSSKKIFAALPKELPAVLLAQRIGEKSAKIKFDWNSADDAWKDVESEIHELKEAENKRHQEEEFGDLLFSLIQWGRHEKIDSEVALQRANHKFLRRFSAMEDLLATQNPDQKMEDLSHEQKNDLWKQVKKLEKEKS